MDLSKGYMVLDVETTGLDPIQDRIVEVGVGLALPPDSPGQPQKGPKVQSWLISTWAEYLTPESSDVHGIEQWEAEGLGLPIERVLHKLERLSHPFPDDRRLIIAHNGFRFDLPFIKQACELCRITGPMCSADLWIDTAALYKGMRLEWEPQPGESHRDYALRVLNARVYGLKYNLMEACANLDIPIDQNDQMHRTSADVKYTAKLFEKMLSLGVRIDGVPS